MAYIIKHLDDGTYVEKFSKPELAVWFTSKDRQALIFESQEEAIEIVQKFNCLASKELQVQSFFER